MQHETDPECHVQGLKELVNAVPKKHAKRIEKFLGWLADQQVKRIDRFVFLSFGKDIGSRCVLAYLLEAVRSLEERSPEVVRELKFAMRDHRRRCDGVRMISDMVKAPWWRPFVPRCDVEQLGAIELAKIDDWLSWMHRHKITSPKVANYLEYASQWESELPLINLHRNLKKLGVVGLPAIEIRLSEAIVQKRASSTMRRAPRSPRRKWPREMSVAALDLPKPWRDAMAHLKKDAFINGKSTENSGMLPSTEKVLRGLCWVQRELNQTPELTANAVKQYAFELRQRDCRSATLELHVSLLLRFMRQIDCEKSDIAEVASLHRRLVADTKKEVPLKFGRLMKVGGTAQILQRAVDLMASAEKEETFSVRVQKLNASVALALFCLLPLRAADTNLRWGRNIYFEGGRYRIFVRISKSDEVYSSQLCEFLSPFLDSLLLRGCDVTFLEAMRKEAIAGEQHLFAHATGRPMSDRRVSNIWTRYVKCGIHIARTMVHTELGKLGTTGIAQALALCAHRHPTTAKYYQGKAMSDALLLKSSIALLDGFSESEVAEYFPELESFG